MIIYILHSDYKAWQSGDTVTPVTVTNPSRGSLMRVSSIRATTSCTRSATFRALGWSTMSSLLAYEDDVRGTSRSARVPTVVRRPGACRGAGAASSCRFIEVD